MRLFLDTASIADIRRAAADLDLEAADIDELERCVADLDGDLWLSCTAPLKHAPQARLGVSGPEGVNAINQLKRTRGEWTGTSTDGLERTSALPDSASASSEALKEIKSVKESRENKNVPRLLPVSVRSKPPMAISSSAATPPKSWAYSAAFPGTGS